MGIRIGKKKFLHFLKIERDLWADDKAYSLSEEEKAIMEKTGLSQNELCYIWRHYGLLTIKYTGDGEYGEHNNTTNATLSKEPQRPMVCSEKIL